MGHDSLYAISERYNNVAALLEDETVPQEAITTALAEVEDSLEGKCESGIGYMATLTQYAESVGAEIKRLQALKKSLESRKARTEAAYMGALKLMGKSKVLTKLGEMQIRRNPASVVVDDPSSIPSEYTKQKIEITPDKVKIKEALKAGETVEGCRLVQGERLVW